MTPHYTHRCEPIGKGSLNYARGYTYVYRGYIQGNMHIVGTHGVHTGYTQEVHTGGTHRGYTQGLHTQGVHTGSTHRWYTHREYTQGVLIQLV